MSFCAAFEANYAGISSPTAKQRAVMSVVKRGMIGEFHLTVTIASADYKANFCDGGHGGETKQPLISNT